MSKSERIKLDNRLRLLIENGVKTNQRSIICLVGEQGRNQVVHIHNILSKARIFNFTNRPEISPAAFPRYVSFYKKILMESYF